MRETCTGLPTGLPDAQTHVIYLRDSTKLTKSSACRCALRQYQSAVLATVVVTMRTGACQQYLDGRLYDVQIMASLGSMATPAGSVMAVDWHSSKPIRRLR